MQRATQSWRYWQSTRCRKTSRTGIQLSVVSHSEPCSHSSKSINDFFKHVLYVNDAFFCFILPGYLIWWSMSVRKHYSLDWRTKVPMSENQLFLALWRYPTRTLEWSTVSHCSRKEDHINFVIHSFLWIHRNQLCWPPVWPRPSSGFQLYICSWWDPGQRGRHGHHNKDSSLPPQQVRSECCVDIHWPRFQALRSFLVCIDKIREPGGEAVDAHGCSGDWCNRVRQKHSSSNLLVHEHLRKSFYLWLYWASFNNVMCMYRLRDFSEWGQCQVLNLLQHYHPASEDELFDMLVSRWFDKTIDCYSLFLLGKYYNWQSSHLVPDTNIVLYIYCYHTWSICLLSEYSGWASEAQQQWSGAGYGPPVPSPHRWHATPPSRRLRQN